MAEFRPVVFDPGPAMGAQANRSRANLALLNDQRALAQRERDASNRRIEGAFALGMEAAASGSVSSIKDLMAAFPDFPGNRLALAETALKRFKEQDRARREAREAGEAERVGPDLARLMATNPEKFQQQAAPYAANPTLLNQLGPMAEVEKLRMAGKLPEQLGSEAVAARGETRRADLQAQKPTQQMADREAEIVLGISYGRTPSPAEQAFLDARARMDPMSALRRDILSGGVSPMIQQPKGSPAENRKANRKAFGRSEETKGWKIVKPNPSEPSEVEANKSGKLVVEKDGQRMIWSRP